MATKTKIKENKFIAIRVTDGDDSFDDNADVAIVEISPRLKSLILKTHEQLLKMKTEIDGVYDIRIFDNSPEFLMSGEFYDTAGEKLNSKVEQTECAEISSKLFDKLGSCNTARADVVLLQVKADAFLWTGYYKHTQVRFTTSAITMEALLSM